MPSSQPMTRRARCAAAVAVIAAALTLVATPAAPAAAPAPDPVIVIGGMVGSSVLAAPSYWPLMARLESAGHAPHQFFTPDAGLGDIGANAGRLAVFVDRVLASTGATRVDIVAHSQGALIARDYVKFRGGADHVDALVMLSPTNHGTASSNLANTFLFGCLGFLGCSQQAIGSAYLLALNAGDDSIGEVVYTTIATRDDTVVIPYVSSFLWVFDGKITNVTVQTHCPGRALSHFSIVDDPAVADGVLDALAGERVQLDCAAT